MVSFINLLCKFSLIASSVIFDKRVKSDTPTSFFFVISNSAFLMPPLLPPPEDLAGTCCCFVLVRPPLFTIAMIK